MEDDNFDKESFSDWETKDFVNEIKKLRKENATRRTKTRDLDYKYSLLNEEHTSQKEKFGKLQEALDSLNKEHELAKKKLDSSSFVSLSTVNLLKKEHDKATDDLGKEASNLKIELSKEKILRNAYNTLNDKGYKFRNSQEKIGFEASILSSGDDGNMKSLEETMISVNSFLDNNFESPNLPPNGPSPNVNRINPAVELAEICKKGNHTQQDINRMMELEKQIEAI